MPTTSPKREFSGLFRQTGLIGFLTFLSRIFGLLRDAAIAYVLGTRASADAFYVAFRIPNLLRRMLAEGNLTLSFVPVFTQSLQNSEREAKDVADVTFTFMLLILTAVTLLGVLGAGYFVLFTAHGFSQDPAKFQLTVQLTRITFPYILLVSLGALVMGILNAKKHFAVPAFSPLLLNVGIILGALGLSRLTRNPSVGIAWGVLVGGLLQLAVQWPLLKRFGFRPRLNFNFKLPALKKILRLMLPTIYGSAVYQLNLLAITFLGSYLPTGSISYLWYADRVIEFPLGIFAVSLATIALPTMSEHAANQDQERMKDTLRRMLTMVWMLNIPAALALMALSKLIIAVLFYRGGFDQASTLLTSQALVFFAVGLPFVSATRITASAFYASQDAKKPVLAANVCVLTTIAAGFLLTPHFQHRGLALAVSLGSIANFLTLMYFYWRKNGSLGFRKMMSDNVRIGTASLAMAALLWFLQWRWDLTFHRFAVRASYLMALIFLGAIFYFILLNLLKVEMAKDFLNSFRRRLAQR